MMPRRKQQQQQQLAWEKSARLPQSNPRRSLFDNPVPHRWNNRSSFSQMAIAECDSAGLNTLPRQRLTPAKPPPWTWDTDPTWKVITVMKGGSSKSSNKDTLLHATIDTLSSSGTPDILIYTDGSAEWYREWRQCGHHHDRSGILRASHPSARQEDGGPHRLKLKCRR